MICFSCVGHYRTWILPDKITVPYRQHCANKGNKDTIFKDGDPHPIGWDYPLGETLKTSSFFSFLTTYPSAKTTSTLPSHLGKMWLRGGIGGQFPGNLNWSYRGKLNFTDFMNTYFCVFTDLCLTNTWIASKQSACINRVWENTNVRLHLYPHF